MPTAVVA